MSDKMEYVDINDAMIKKHLCQLSRSMSNIYDFMAVISGKCGLDDFVI